MCAFTCGKTTLLKVCTGVRPKERATSICDVSTVRSPDKVAKMTYGKVVIDKIKAAAKNPEKSGTKAIQVYVNTYEGMARGSTAGIINRRRIGNRT